MQVYDLKKLEKCFVCGNIDRNMDRFINMITSNLSNYTKQEHPKEIERQERLKQRTQGGIGVAMFGNRNAHFDAEMRNMNKKMKVRSSWGDSNYNDSVIIVGGNCGIGNKSMKYYQETFEKLDRVLADNNCFIFFVRGNNDNPSMFNENKINFEHVKTLQDYSVIQLKNFNCLCIGGSVSLDKEWKLAQEKDFGKKLFWEGEQPYFDEKTLEEILKKYKIGCVISSTSPSFAFPGTNAFNKTKWFKEDTSIKRACTKERKILDKIYDKIIDADVKPYAWLYGRFKQSNKAKVNDIVFDSLHSFQIENVGNLISSFFGIDVSKKLGDNTFALDSLFAEEEQRQTLSRFRANCDAHEPHAEDEGEDEEFNEIFDEEDEEADRENEGVAEIPRNEYIERLNEAVGELRGAEGVQAAYNTITAEDIERTTRQLEGLEFIHRVNQIDAATTAQTIATNNTEELRWEMPQYTFNNGRIEIINRNG
jgi:predicted phosphodiesterase